MTIKEIPEFMGLSQKALAAHLQVSSQALGQYMNGQRGAESKFVRELLTVTNLQGEYIVFPDSFDHPDGENCDHPAYFLNIAIESLREAQKRGVKTDSIILELLQLGEKTLSEL